MKGKDRAEQPGPRSDFNRDDQPATSDDIVCEQCGGPLNRAFRFCAYDCHHQWRREHPPGRPEGPTPEEMRAEMLAGLDELRAFIEEVTR